MICTKCNTKGVLNTVAGVDFYYCRNCKEEITLQISSNGNGCNGYKIGDKVKHLKDGTIYTLKAYIDDLDGWVVLPSEFMSYKIKFIESSILNDGNFERVV